MDVMNIKTDMPKN